MINLMAGDTKQQRKFVSYAQMMVRVNIFIGLMILTVFISYRVGIMALESQTDTITSNTAADNAQIAQASDTIEQAETLSDKIETVSTVLGREVAFTQLLAALGSVVPEGGFITGTTLTNNLDDPLEIQATLPSEDAVLTFAENLRGSAAFGSADILNIVSPPADDGGSQVVNAAIVTSFADIATIQAVLAGEELEQ